MDVPEGQDGIWNRADDDDSGTAAILEIARRLKQGTPPRRSVLILFTSGEELGLLRSAYYARHPLVPMEKDIANINVDMIGCSQGAAYALATGSDDLFNQTAAFGEKSPITIKPDPFPA
jgi:Zn-dependent M28 family amino/carboxypeptidase